jgi:hypothetical protein
MVPENAILLRTFQVLDGLYQADMLPRYGDTAKKSVQPSIMMMRVFMLFLRNHADNSKRATPGNS